MTATLRAGLAIRHDVDEVECQGAEPRDVEAHADSARSRGDLKAVGADGTLSVFQTEVELSPADRLVCCTDGVSDNLLGDELMEIVRGAADAETASARVKALVDEHIEQGRDIRFRGGRFRHDDETAIFRFFGES